MVNSTEIVTAVIEEPQRLISISLSKIASGRSHRAGVNLHRNLLVSSVLQRARHAYYLDMVAAGSRRTRRWDDDEEMTEVEVLGEDDEEREQFLSTHQTNLLSSETDLDGPATNVISHLCDTRVIVEPQPGAVFCGEDSVFCGEDNVFSDESSVFSDEMVNDFRTTRLVLDEYDSVESSSEDISTNSSMDSVTSSPSIDKENASPDEVESTDVSDEITVEDASFEQTVLTDLQQYALAKRKLRVEHDDDEMTLPKKQARCLTSELAVHAQSYHLTVLGAEQHTASPAFNHFLVEAATSSLTSMTSTSTINNLAPYHHTTDNISDYISTVDNVPPIISSADNNSLPDCRCGGVTSLVTIFSSGFNGLISRSQEMLQGGCEDGDAVTLANQALEYDDDDGVKAWNKVLQVDCITNIPIVVQE